MKLLGVLSLGAFLVIAFGYVTIFGGPAGTEIVPATTDRTPFEQNDSENEIDLETRDAFSGAGSIRSLYQRGDSIECQITYIPNAVEAEITGNIFTADGRVRGDFVVPSPDMNGQTVASLIFDTSTLYIWSDIDGETFGVKQPQTSFTGFGDSAAAIDYDTEVQYNCLTWPMVDNTIFEPPTNVLFSDIQEINANMEFGTLFEDENGELPL